jgi:transcriptional regulator with XRE-family HTH domain
MTDALLTIAQWVTRERKARRWSQAQLAARAGVGMSAVRNMEEGAGTRVVTLLCVVEALSGRVSLKKDHPLVENRNSDAVSA